MCKQYYLDTNAVYKLANKLKDIAKSNVAISLLVMKEIISGLKNEEEFNRRKILIEKIRDSKIKIYPDLPMECIWRAFRKDISGLEFVVERKNNFGKE